MTTPYDFDELPLIVPLDPYQYPIDNDDELEQEENAREDEGDSWTPEEDY